MNSEQYEELCRVFLAEKFCVGIDEILSGRLPNPRRSDCPQYHHQIDLYWEHVTEVAAYLHIANAKWRSKDKVDQPDVLLLQQVKLKNAAHKAIMLTPTGFTSGAVAAAKDEGIALHVVAPTFDVTVLPVKGHTAIQAKLQELARNASEPLYSHQIEHRALTPRSGHAAVVVPTSRPPSYETRVLTGYSSKPAGPHVTKGVSRITEQRGGHGSSNTRGA